MFKKIILGSFFLFSLHNQAQEGTASAYSAHGIGEIKFKGTAENRSMGGMSVLNDSININIQNPAALTSLKLSSLTVGGTFAFSDLVSGSVAEKTQRTTVDYFAMAFPAGKLVVSLGLYPYTSIGYKIDNVANGLNTRAIGSGGLNRSFVAAGYQLNKKFSVGAEFNYDFGKFEKQAVVSNSENANGTFEKKTGQLSGTNFKLSTYFKTKIAKYDLVSSVYYLMPLSLTSDYKVNQGVFSTLNGTETNSTDPRFNVENRLNLRNQAVLSFGSGVGLDKKWYVGFESQFRSAGDLMQGTVAGADLNPYFEASSKIILGAYYTPKYNSYTNYLSRVTYRAGVRYENSGLVIKGESIKDKAFTLGLGLPFGNGFSNLNFGVEFGKKGTTVNGLLQENYTNLSVGLTFSDRWFVKRKYD